MYPITLSVLFRDEDGLTKEKGFPSTQRNSSYFLKLTSFIKGDRDVIF